MVQRRTAAANACVRTARVRRASAATGAVAGAVSYSTTYPVSGLRAAGGQRMATRHAARTRALNAGACARPRPHLPPSDSGGVQSTCRLDPDSGTSVTSCGALGTARRRDRQRGVARRSGRVGARGARPAPRHATGVAGRRGAKLGHALLTSCQRGRAGGRQQRQRQTEAGCCAAEVAGCSGCRRRCHPAGDETLNLCRLRTLGSTPSALTRAGTLPALGTRVCARGNEEYARLSHFPPSFRWSTLILLHRQHFNQTSAPRGSLGSKWWSRRRPASFLHSISPRDYTES